MTLAKSQKVSLTFESGVFRVIWHVPTRPEIEVVAKSYREALTLFNEFRGLK